MYMTKVIGKFSILPLCLHTPNAHFQKAYLMCVCKDECDQLVIRLPNRIKYEHGMAKVVRAVSIKQPLLKKYSTHYRTLAAIGGVGVGGWGVCTFKEGGGGGGVVIIT